MTEDGDRLPREFRSVRQRSHELKDANNLRVSCVSFGFKLEIFFDLMGFAADDVPIRACVALAMVR